MSATIPRGRSSHRRGRCKCAGGGNGDRAACCFNPLRSLFRSPGRGRGRSRSKHQQRTPPRVRDAPTPPGGVAQQQDQEEEPSFFVYAMPSQSGSSGGDGAGHRKNKKKHRKPSVPSFGSCFCRKKKERKATRAAATVMTDRCPALTPATSMLTHPLGSPVPERSQAVTPSMTQPPSPAPTENNSVVNSPAPPGRQSAARGLLPATPKPETQSTDSARSPFELHMQQQLTTDSAWSPLSPQSQQQPTKNIDGIEIVEVATGERLSTHELGLMEMVAGSSTENSAESSVKSSLEYVNEPPPPPAKQMVVEREMTVVKAREPLKLWLNGTTMESRARERFTETH